LKTPAPADYGSYRDRKWKGAVAQLFSNIFLQDGFVADVTIPPASEISIPNQLGVVPRYYVIVSDEGLGIIKKGVTPWTNSSLSLRNVSSSSNAIAKVKFLK
jgi:hypothetical protein